MNKFVKGLAGNADEVLLKRATDVAVSVGLAQQALLNRLQTAQAENTASLNRLLDLAPESTTSLRVGVVDAESWVNQVQSLKLTAARLAEQVSIASATYHEYFDEVPAGQQPVAA